jgi:hypothetical protein
MSDGRRPANSHRLQVLAEKFHDKRYRDGYVAAHTRGVLARQMRNFRGELSQAEYAAKIGKQKTVVGRLENPAYGGWSVRTMLEIAQKENIAVIARFVDFPTFLSFTDDISNYALHPLSYDEAEIGRFAAYQTAAVSYDYISITGDNRATSMGPAGPTTGPMAYPDIFFFAPPGELQTGTIGTTSGTLLPTGAGLGTVSPTGFSFPFQGNYVVGSSTVWPMPYVTTASLFTTAAFTPPPTPNALHRAHAEIRRLEHLVQEQRQQIDQLQRQLNAPRGVEATVINLPSADNWVQSQMISFREAA